MTCAPPRWKALAVPLEEMERDYVAFKVVRGTPIRIAAALTAPPVSWKTRWMGISRGSPAPIVDHADGDTGLGDRRAGRITLDEAERNPLAGFCLRPSAKSSFRLWSH